MDSGLIHSELEIWRLLCVISSTRVVAYDNDVLNGKKDSFGFHG